MIDDFSEMTKSIDLNKTYTNRGSNLEPVMSVRQQQSCKRGPVDLLSNLPDEILHLILSRLPTEDAVKTSLVSTRWTNLWRQSLSLDLSGDFYVRQRIACDHYCGCPFDPDKFIVRPSWKPIWEESSKFISRVNRALQLHQAPALEEFRVRVDYRYMFIDVEDIAEWIRYAFSKRVQRLELDFLKFSEYPGGRLSFDDVSSVVASGDVPFPKAYLDSCIDFNCLKEVTLKGFNVTNEVIEYLLLKCRYLERLTLVGADISNDVAVSSPSLKYLNITDAYLIKSINICSCPSLETLIIDSHQKVMLTGAPKLFELHIYGGHYHCQHSDFARSYHLSQLEVLMLHALGLKHILELEKHLPELSKLKKLTINTGVFDDHNNDNLIRLIPLLNACPNLHKFVLQMFWDCPSRTNTKVERTKHAVKLEHLKVVEVSGYYGCWYEDEFIMYLLENAGSVEKLILDPRSNTSMIGTPPSHEIEEKQASICASQLQALVPSHIQVTIL